MHAKGKAEVEKAVGKKSRNYRGVLMLEGKHGMPCFFLFLKGFFQDQGDLI
jgi:hypothetical protein